MSQERVTQHISTMHTGASVQLGGRPGGPANTEPLLDSGEVKRDELPPPLEGNRMRYLWTPPTLFQDWDQDYEERASAWWELFVDLLLVAACSNIADGFKENLTQQGFGLFALQMLVYSSTWGQYVGYTSRYRDDSLGHSVLLFVYIAGSACMVVHSGSFNASDIQGFSAGMLIQKSALILMNSIVYVSIPRARAMSVLVLIEAFISMACATVAFQYPKLGQLPFWMWGVTLIVEFILRIAGGFLLPHHSLLPINIDHMTDRMGCFIMVVLGESVVSEAISYQTLPREARTAGRYYGGALLGFLLTFSLALVYFHLQPPREQHAFRISRVRGLLLSRGQQGLSLSLLGVGVGIKFAMAAVVGESIDGSSHRTRGGEGEGEAGGEGWGEGEVEGEASGRTNGNGMDTGVGFRALNAAEYGSSSDFLMPPLRVWVLMISLSCTLACLFVMRMAHFGFIEPRANDMPAVYRLKMVWWCLVATTWIPPLVAAALLTRGRLTDGNGEGEGEGDTSPIVALGVAAGCAAVTVALESALTHILLDTVAVAKMRHSGSGVLSRDLIAEWMVGDTVEVAVDKEGGNGKREAGEVAVAAVVVVRSDRHSGR